jgi:alpha-L-fucosidase
VINNRGYDEGDFGTPERDYDPGRARACGPSTGPPRPASRWGTESWGYRKDEDYYTDRHLMRSIDKYLARGANYLLNVGPTGEGDHPPVQQPKSCAASGSGTGGSRSRCWTWSRSRTGRATGRCC